MHAAAVKAGICEAHDTTDVACGKISATFPETDDPVTEEPDEDESDSDTVDTPET